MPNPIVPQFTAISLASGVGGLDLAASWAGFDIRALVEIDEFCRKVLTKHAPRYWPNAQILTDVRECGGHNLEMVHLVYGGFPCQSVSVAGKRAGISSDTQSGLWAEFARIIGELRPRVVLLENVPGLRSLGGVTVIGDLTRLGYDCLWVPLQAADVGAPHKRERWFCLAYATSDAGQLQSGGRQDLRNEPAINGAAGVVRAPMAYRHGTRTDDALQAGRNTADTGSTPELAHTTSGGQSPAQQSGQLCGVGSGGQLADAACECGAHVAECADCRPLGSAVAGTGGGIERGTVAEGVRVAGGIEACCQAHVDDPQEQRWRVRPDGADIGQTVGDEYALAGAGACGSERHVGHPNGGRCEQCNSPERGLQESDAGCADMGDTNSAGLEVGDGRESGQRTLPATVLAGPGEVEPGLGGAMSDGLPAWLDGFTGWAAPPGQPQFDYEPPRVVTEKVPNRTNRLKALGNAVVPQCAYPLFLTLRAWLEMTE